MTKRQELIENVDRCAKRAFEIERNTDHSKAMTVEQVEEFKAIYAEYEAAKAALADYSGE